MSDNQLTLFVTIKPIILYNKMKNNLLFYVLAYVVFMFSFSCSSKVNREQDKTQIEMNKKISELLSRMTLEQKVGQMTQLTLEIFYKDTLNKKLLHEYIVKYGIGSILNSAFKHKKTEAISQVEWRELIAFIQKSAEKSLLKIPVLYGIDAIHGMTYREGATLFPHNIGIAASRDTMLAHEIAKLTAKEVRASGIRWNFNPVLGVGRQPLWSRFEETFGEDSYLVTEMGNAAIRGYEEDGLLEPTAVAACMKHYLGYSVPITGKDRTPSYIPDNVLRQIFLPPFKRAVETGVSTVMISSGSINGVPVHASRYLITDVLKNQYGFKGIVVTDWEDINFLVNEHHVAKNAKEATMIAINSGIDMCMVPNDLSFYHNLIELVKEGKVSETRVNDAVYRILKVKFELGLFDNPFPESETEGFIETGEYKQIALKAAQESITLLKNDTLKGKPILPLQKNIRLLIAGPGTNSISTLHGSWSYSWQGRDESLYPDNIQTIRAALEDKIGKDRVVNISPNEFTKVSLEQINSLKKRVKKVDAIILCLGENSYAEGLGNIDDLTLSEDQLQLAKSASETNKPVILILTEGRPRIISSIEPHIDGILQAYRPGNMGAEAIVNVLFGDINPSGKLPYTYPRYTGNIINYDMPVRTEKHYNPQWEFGFGLSYTSFNVTSLNINKDTLQVGDTLIVTANITNAGKRDGDVSLDLFVKDLTASIAPPMKKLRKFSRIDIKVGETKQVSFKLADEDWAFFNSSAKLQIESGDMEVLLQNKSVGFYLKR